MARVSLGREVSRSDSLRHGRLRLTHCLHVLTTGRGLNRRTWLFVLGLVMCSLAAVPTVRAHAVFGPTLPSSDLLSGLFVPSVEGVGVLEGVNLFEPIARGLLYASLVVLVGVPLALDVVVRPVLGVSEHLAKRSWTLLMGGSILLALSAALLGAIRISRLGLTGPWFEAVVSTFLGRIMLVQLAVASLLVVIGVAVRQQPRTGPIRRVWLGAVFTGGVLSALTVSLTSHSASHIVGVAGVLVDLGHIVGAGVWVGGLAALALLATPELGTRETEAARQATVQLIRRFSVVAIAAVGLAVASGLLLIAWHVPDFGAFTATRYGTVLSVKVLFVLVAIGLGGLNRFVIQRSLIGSAGSSTTLADGGLWSRRPDRRTIIRWFVRSVRVELTVFLLVLALTGVLTSLPTATVAERSTTDVAGDRTVLTEESGAIEIRLEIVPARIGQNTIEVSFVRAGSLVTLDRNITLSLIHPETDITLPRETLTVNENGYYSGTVVFPTHGQWTIQVRTQINGRSVTEQFSVRIPTGDTGGETEIESSHRHGTADGSFAWFVRVGALLVGIMAMLAVGYDLFTLRGGGRRG